jgi:hypothetical protein
LITLLLIWCLGAFVLWPISRHRLVSFGSIFAAGLSAAVFSAILGALVFSTLQPSVMLLQFSPLLLLGVLVWRRPDKRNFQLSGGSETDRLLGFGFFLIALVGVIGLVRLVGVPIQMYDVLSYHLPLAQQFNSPETLSEVLFHPTTFYARLPLGAPILEAPFATAAYAGGLGLGIQLLIMVSILAGASCCWRIAGWLGGRWTARALAACLYLFHHLCLKGMLQAVYDPIVALLTIASLELLLVACSKKGTMWHGCLSGVMVGTAISLKLNAVGVALVPLGFVAIWLMFPAFQKRDWKRIVRVLLPLAGGVVLVLSPWLIRGMMVGGHPLHPFQGFSDLWSAQQAEFVVQVHEPQTPLGLGWWRDVFTRSRFLGYTIPYTTISWLPLMALLCLLHKRQRWMLGLVLAGLGGYGAWLTVRLNPDRFLLPTIVFLLPVAAVAISQWLHRPGKRALSFGLCAFVLFCFYQEDFRWLQGDLFWKTSERVAMLDSLGPVMRTVEVANEHTASRDGRLLLLFEARPALFTCDTESSTVWDQPQWKPLLKSAASAQEFNELLVENGITGIFVNEVEWGRFLDFYAKDKLPSSAKWMGLMGLRHPQAFEGLKYYPPHQFAEFTDRELEIFHQFLEARRRVALQVAPVGPMGEIWFAPLAGNTEEK